MNEWISVKDKLPKQDEPVLVSYIMEARGCRCSPTVCEYRDGEWYENDFPMSEWCFVVTHWMPLPPNPDNEVSYHV